MVKKAVEPDIAQFIAPLNMNGLQGRMLTAPPTGNRKREILVVYGHHSKIERWWSLAQSLQSYGRVTVPDLPGFGGMQSFYQIGKRPTIDNYADYLATFIRFRYKRKRVTVVGISFGFAVVTRMLQRYPELVTQVDIVVSMVGFMHHDDFLISTGRRRLLVVVARIVSFRPLALSLQYAIRPLSAVWNMYCKLSIRKRSLLNMDPLSGHLTPNAEGVLWRVTDAGTHWRLMAACLQLDNCHEKIALPVWHLYLKHHGQVDELIAKQHILIVYSSCRLAMIKPTPRDDKSSYAAEGDIGIILPPGLRKALQ
jgi:pimeloyl-ACP methyl ester carboxylesterase